MKIQYHSVKKNYKKLATRAISAGHLASLLYYNFKKNASFSVAHIFMSGVDLVSSNYEKRSH